MTPTRRKRLWMILFLVAGVSAAVALAVNAFNKNILFYIDPTQLAAGEAPAERRFSLGGMVKDGSVVRDPNSTLVQFTVTDYQNDAVIMYDGILPDLFREGQGIVAKGKLNEQGIFMADTVLAKHDEKYMPPEVADSLKKPAPTSTDK